LAEPHKEPSAVSCAEPRANPSESSDATPGSAASANPGSAPYAESGAAACANPSAKPSLEPIWKPDKPSLLSQWKQRWEEAKEDASPFVLEALQLQGEVLRQTDFAPFERAAPGWTHLDLWADNLLFAPDRVSAIVDFDRTRYSFPLLDFGRAVLSLALDEGEFCRESAAAFAEGYRKAQPFPRGELLNAVRLAWVMESFWWLRPRMETYSVAPSRFAKEMIWTAKQWDRLEHRLGGI
jgi:homoserine kinase type II